MAYFNIKLAEDRQLAPLDVFLMQLIHQNRTEDMSEGIALILQEDSYMRLYEEGLITMIKAKNKDHTEPERLRLTKKGKNWYRDFQTYEADDKDFKIFESLEAHYKKHDKDIGSKKKTVELLAWFRKESGFSHREVWLIAKTFIQDEKEMEYSNVLEYIIWKSSNHFQTKAKLEDSRLWNYYEKNKEWFDKEFKKLEK